MTSALKMMKNSSSASMQTRHAFRFAYNLLLILSVTLCILSLLKLSSSSSRSFPAPLRTLSSSSLDPKIAFLFLARRNLPLDFLWDSFFEDADVPRYSIYVHSEPGFVFNESSTRSHFFYGRQLNNSIQVAWGESSMIEAERLLLGASLQDPDNQRFILLSDSCIPLYNFSYIYNYVMSSSRSFVDSFHDVKGGRYNPKMSPTIPKDKWRKGSQWIAMIRRHAEIVVEDEAIISVFKKFCKHLPPPYGNKGMLNTRHQKEHDCIPDEHYVQTMLAMNNLDGQLERRTLTYTTWNQSMSKLEKGWHPMTFTYGNAGPKRIKEIKDISHVYYATEFQTEWCRANSSSVPCFLFARKFSRPAAMRLLSDGLIAPFDASAIMSASL